MFDTLTVAENVALALPPGTDRAGLEGAIRDMGDATAAGRSAPARLLLSVGERQRVEIIRRLLQAPRLLIMDEPTSADAAGGGKAVPHPAPTLAGEGVSVLYISHKLEEVRALCTRATVLRGGRVTGTCDPRAESVASLSRLMIGAEPPRIQRRCAREPGEPLLVVEPRRCRPRSASARRSPTCR